MRTARRARLFSLHGNWSMIKDLFSILRSFCLFPSQFCLNIFHTNKLLIYISRSPDTSRVRSKMIYASSKDRFKRELDGIQVELQATDPTEMGLDVMRSRSN